MRGHVSLRRSATAIIVGAATLVAAAGVSYAAAGRDGGSAGQPTRFYACVTAAGVLVLTTADARCPRGERKISWNAQGPRGLTGATGPRGPKGATGASGSSGSGGGTPFLFNEEFFSDGPFYCGLTGGPSQRNCASDSGAASGQPMPVACTLKSLHLSVMNAAGTSADAITATVRVNGVATALTASADTTGTVGQSVSATDTSDTVPVAVGDLVGITVTRTDGTEGYEVGTGVICQ